MNTHVELPVERAAAQRLELIDCDIHPIMRSPKDLLRYLPSRWREHHESYGFRFRQPFIGSSAYPKATPALSRRDAWPPNGGPPGSDLDFMREQHLDPLGITTGLLHPLFPLGMDERNLDFASAVCSGVNDWQFEEWISRDPRLKGNIVVACNDPAASVREIERCGSDGHHVQVSFATRAGEPLGSRRFWPIYEAAERHGLPLGLHSLGANGHSVTGSGWASYYFEEHQAVSVSLHAMVASFVLEGVFEEFSKLKLVVVEGGFAWLASLAWRLDEHWKRFRSEIPHLPEPPSFYIKRNVYCTTQPMDEPASGRDLKTVMDWIGWDRILFATDYPHWDSDDPRYAFKFPMSEAERQAVFRDNAKSVYGL